MYIVICQTSYSIWYDEFSSLSSALDYMEKYDDRWVTVRLFVGLEIEDEFIQKCKQGRR